ncbi:hypothetical protein CI15_08775 [Paraburkholderia monticola]|uniref:Uncharacterized protein n=1 Tax=Paraburkholderia monticola TaxID=1399968 RepID=A0A149PVS4_9BURK|nr:hypothetical protein [Paraburkholderia monticola]KXU89132.1 hypothetical protein CI15_08775 [Paraburkholderia monticola]
MPTSGVIGVYAIYNPTAGTQAILGQANSTITTVFSNFYSGSHMPSGYTASGLIACLIIASSMIAPVSVVDRTHVVAGQSLFGATTTTVTPTVQAFTNLPGNAKQVRGTIATQLSTTGATGNFTVYPAANSVRGKILSFVAAVSNDQHDSPWVSPILTLGSLWYIMSVSTGTINSNVSFSECDI